jgi:hypothetical protein
VILSKTKGTDRKEDTAAAVVKSMDLVAALREGSRGRTPMCLGELLEGFVNALMSAEGRCRLRRAGRGGLPGPGEPPKRLLGPRL